MSTLKSKQIYRVMFGSPIHQLPRYTACVPVHVQAHTIMFKIIRLKTAACGRKTRTESKYFSINRYQKSKHPNPNYYIYILVYIVFGIGHNFHRSFRWTDDRLIIEVVYMVFRVAIAVYFSHKVPRHLAISTHTSVIASCTFMLW